MNRIQAVAVALLVGAVFVLCPSPHPVRAGSGDVILIYGWMGSAAKWDTAKAAYEAQGYTVHALTLPRDFSHAGDVKINAEYVQQYMTDHGIAQARIDGHSMGGITTLYLATVKRDPRILSGVMRDSGTVSGGVQCWFVPDSCTSSAAIKAIAASPPPAVPILLMRQPTTSGTDQYARCVRVFSISHNEFLTDSRVNAAAVAWPSVNPCGG